MVCAAIEAALRRNKEWAAGQIEQDPTFFTRLAHRQTPDFLWIGCSDARAPANTLLGLPAGSVFEQRNVGNQASHGDLNCQAVLEFGVAEVQVKHIIVCGHTQCGAVKGALTMPHTSQGAVNLWLADLRDTVNSHRKQLESLEGSERTALLAELNVKRQVFNVCTSPAVQRAWEEGKTLSVHGFMFEVEEGILVEVVQPIASMEEANIYKGTVVAEKLLAGVEPLCSCGAPSPSPMLLRRASMRALGS